MTTPSAGSRWSRTPFDPAAAPVPYAYVIAVAGTLGIVFSAPGQTIGVSAFTDLLLEVLVLDRMDLATAYMIGTVASGLLLPLAGALYDRFGARALVPADCLLLGGVLLLLSRCDGLVARAGAAAPWANPTHVAIGVMSLLFLLLRLSGQGMLTLFSRNMVMEWFDRRRGMVAAIQGLVVGGCFAFAPKVFDMLIQAHGWRGAWVILAVVAGLGFSLVSLIVYRRDPESCGLLPDGATAPPPDAAKDGTRESLAKHTDEADAKTEGENDPAEGGADAPVSDPASPPDRAYRVGQALRTPVFWIFNLGTTAFSLYITAFTFHIVDIFAEAGLDRAAAMNFFPKSAILGALGGVAVSFTADRVQPRWLLSVQMAGLLLLAGGMLLLGPWPLGGQAALILGNALAMATFGTVAAITWPRLFGRTHLGAISGFNMSSLVIGSAVGPLLFAWSRDATESYARAAWIGLGVMVLLFLATFAAHDPGTPLDQTGSPRHRKPLAR